MFSLIEKWNSNLIQNLNHMYLTPMKSSRRVSLSIKEKQTLRLLRRKMLSQRRGLEKQSGPNFRMKCNSQHSARSKVKQRGQQYRTTLEERAFLKTQDNRDTSLLFKISSKSRNRHPLIRLTQNPPDSTLERKLHPQCIRRTTTLAKL